MDVLDIARFWSKVAVTRNINECWLWRGSRSSFGHGDFKVDGKAQPSHRVAFELAFGEPPDDAVIRHSCDTPACCNPNHLLSGTHADNVRDRVIRKRSAIGEDAGRAKLTEKEVLEIRAKPDMPLRLLASQYGVTTDTIQAIRYRRSWKHI